MTSALAGACDEKASVSICLVRPTWMFAYRVKVPYRYPRIAKMLYQLLAEGKGILVRVCLKEKSETCSFSQVQNREPMYKNMIMNARLAAFCPVPEAS